jgi:hypothetical protein
MEHGASRELFLLATTTSFTTSRHGQQFGELRIES